MTHLRLVRDPEPSHSVKVAPRVTGDDLYRYSTTANAELLHATATGDTALEIAACRRLVAIGELARSRANHLEKGTA